MKACYTVKSHLTRPQTLTAVKVSKEQPPQPCAFDTPLRASTVPGLFGKAGLDGKPPPFWEATMAWTRAAPVLKRKLQQLPFSEFAQISRAKRLKFSQNSAGWRSIYSAWLTECHSGEKRADNNKFLTGFVKRWLQKLWKQANSAEVKNLKKSYPPHPCALVRQLPITYPHHSVGSLWLVIKSKLSFSSTLVQGKLSMKAC